MDIAETISLRQHLNRLQHRITLKQLRLTSLITEYTDLHRTLPSTPNHSKINSLSTHITLINSSFDTEFRTYESLTLKRNQIFASLNHWKERVTSLYPLQKSLTRQQTAYQIAEFVANTHNSLAQGMLMRSKSMDLGRRKLREESILEQQEMRKNTEKRTLFTRDKIERRKKMKIGEEERKKSFFGNLRKEITKSQERKKDRLECDQKLDEFQTKFRKINE